MPLKKVEKRFVPFFKAGKIWGDFFSHHMEASSLFISDELRLEKFEKTPFKIEGKNNFSAQVLPHSFSN